MKLDALLNRLATRFRAPSADETRARLHAKYDALRALTAANNAALDILADLQRTATGEFLFDASYARDRSNRALAFGREVVDAIGVLTDGRHRPLAVALERVAAEVSTLLARRVEVPPGPFVLPLDEARTAAPELTGAKIRRLAEIRARGGIPVPDGFVVTSAACQRLLAHENLRAAIQQAIEQPGPIDRQALAQASARITAKIVETEWPREIARAILAAHDELMARAGDGGRLASVRSSAIGEDEESTFAGQYASLLNVPRQHLLHACKQVLASQFGPRAVIYYKARGLDQALLPMALGVMVMVDARASGVLYTASPDGDETMMVASGTWGLGPSTAEGRVTPDVFHVARATGDVVDSRVAAKEKMLLAHKDGDLVEVIVPSWMRRQPCLTREQIRELATCGRRLEQYYRGPQDVEWALDAGDAIVVLQSRPLLVRPRTSVAVVAPRKDLPVLLDGGAVASRGVAAGPVAIVRESAPGDVPRGSVVVAHSAAPALAVVIDRAAAIVTEVGSIASHLATVAREFGIPALFDAPHALEVLREGDVVTVDAEMGNVYAGRIQALLDLASKHDESGALAHTPVVRRLRAVNRVLTPLNLTDPRSPRFRPSGCRTLHDILRYAHEIGVQEMFLAGSEAGSLAQSATLASALPLKIRVIDLGGGLEIPDGATVVTPSQLRCRPFVAFWGGLCNVAWNRAPAVRGGNLGSVMLAALSSRDADLAAEPDYALLTDAYMNVNLRFGYHFSRVDAFLGPRLQENYASVVFHGGAADLDGRTRRIDFIAAVLEGRRWSVARRDDALFARVEALPETEMAREIEVAGRLLVVTRQIDTVLDDQATTARAIAAFQSGDDTLGLGTGRDEVDRSATERSGA